jgi:hypothetical protein
MPMFTKTFTIERHIEELRAELRRTTNAKEAREIKADLDAMTLVAGNLDGEKEVMA